MFPANAYPIRPATADDAIALRRLAADAGEEPLAGRILVAEAGGAIIAALSRDQQRTLSARSAPAYVATLLRLRDEGLTAYEREPRLSERMREAVLGKRAEDLARAA
jgi:hypothetical protein